MKTVKLEEAEIPGAVLSREVDESVTAIITLKHFDDLGKALVVYKASVSYYQRQADYFNQRGY